MSDWQEANASTGETWDGTGEVQGQYIEKKTNIGPHSSNIYVLKTPEGNIGVWGSTVIDSKFETIPTGVEVKVKYNGMTKGKRGNEYKDYLVFFRGVPFQEATSQALTTPADEPPVESREPQGEETPEGVPF